MPETYQLSWNAKKYDWKKRMEASMADPQKRIFTQSLGRKLKPEKFKVGDIVYITCSNKCIMKGVIKTPFSRRVELVDDEYSLGPITEMEDRHRDKWYCEIEITNWFLGEHQHTMRGNQVTLCQPKNAFWN
tara:strand:+ start:249 stop:641 length:393 start_codon:yes stop_codon:yes gene_type:complete